MAKYCISPSVYDPLYDRGPREELFVPLSAQKAWETASILKPTDCIVMVDPLPAVNSSSPNPAVTRVLEQDLHAEMLFG